MLNPFFLNGTQQEQSLVQDLINEQLRMYGVEVYYMPRQYITKNTVIREVIESEFNNAYPIEAYVNNFDGYNDNSQLLSKFGIQATNEINLVISQERFETYISPLSSNLPNAELGTRPKEGDLIYFPLGERLFEIKFVEHEKPFYMLQKNYVYELRCELFRYEDEVIDTGIDEIDDEVLTDGNIRTLNLISPGTAKTATAAVSGICTLGGLVSVTMTNRGERYMTPPDVKISVSPTGENATGIATLISGLTNCDGTQIGSKVQGVTITNTGCGYTVAPGIVFVGLSTDTGVGAAATTAIGNGTLRTINITDGGGGYVTAPAVTISGPGIGTTATAMAVVGSGGTISAIRFTYAGVGYTSTPTVTIAAPAGIGATVGVGTFILNEIVTGYDSGSTARVKTWTQSTGVLTINNATADFNNGEVIYGSESGAVYRVNYETEDNTVSAYPDNDTIQSEADAILDFSEGNPFGTP